MSRIAPLRVLVIGAGGLFGRGFVQGLAREPGFDIVLAGRTEAPLRQQCAQLDIVPGSCVNPARLDIHAADFPDTLRVLAPDLVVHCAGPFQGADYRVPEACIALGIDQVDLADGRDYVAGIGALDARAREHGTFVLSGASTVPALSGAVIRHLARDMAEVRAIDLAISPGNRVERGLATVTAILGYCGQPIPSFHGGRFGTVAGWSGLRRVRFGDPIGNRWQSCVDLPDMALLPQRYPGLRDLEISAGLELSLLHLGLSFLSRLAAMGVLPLARLARPMKWMADRLLPFGTDAGGLVAVVSGRDAAGAAATARFDLVAQGGVGPRVPTLAALIAAKRLRDGVPIEPGARPADLEFAFDEFAREWTALGIRGDVRVGTTGA